MSAVLAAVEAKPLKLDLGCGKNKKADFFGVDSIAFDGVDLQLDLVARDWRSSPIDGSMNIIYPRIGHIYKQWPWENESVDEIHSSHFVEHLDGSERVHFVNECYRIMKPGAKAQIVIPHWAAARAYGDVTHKWPPVSEFWFYYLSKKWREDNAPHNDFYKCDFDATWGYSLHPSLAVRNQEYQQYAMGNFKEACQDTIATLTKRA